MVHCLMLVLYVVVKQIVTSRKVYFKVKMQYIKGNSVVLTRTFKWL